MMQNTPSSRKNRFAWGAVTAAAILVSALSVAVPRAVAQQTDKGSTDTRRYIEVLDNAFRFVLQNYVDVPDPQKLYEGAMKGMFEALGDPYSVFLNEAMLSDMNDVTQGEFGGVGLYISKQLKDPRLPADEPRYIEIVSPIEDTPGWKFGILPGDLISKIDGETTAPLSVDEAQKRIRGKPGSIVVLTIRRGAHTEFEAPIARARIEIPTVKKAMIPTDQGNVAYLRIIEFSPATKPRVDEALKEFAKAGYRSLVIDVRNNPGGLLQSVIQISDLFLDSGVIVSTKGRNPYETSVARAKSDLAVPKEKNIVLLLNRGSASASEILAGALKDNKRAYLVGENSYGKGSVQQIYPIDSTGFKLTTARYYTPSDENIDKTGIPPDLEAKDPELGKAEAEALGKLIESGKIADFAKAKSEATKAERDAFAATLTAEYGLSDRLMKRLVRDQLARTKVAPVYDLEFDTALNAAIAVLEKPDFARIVAETRSVKELVETKKAATATLPADKNAKPNAAAQANADATGTKK